MTIILKSHNIEEEFDDLDYISENCGICGIELINIEDILVSVESDQYLCQECATYHKLNVVLCADI